MQALQVSSLAMAGPLSALNEQAYHHNPAGSSASDPALPLNAPTILQCPYTASTCPILAPFNFEPAGLPAVSVESPAGSRPSPGHPCPALTPSSSDPGVVPGGSYNSQLGLSAGDYSLTSPGQNGLEATTAAPGQGDPGNAWNGEDLYGNGMNGYAQNGTAQVASTPASASPMSAGVANAAPSAVGGMPPLGEIKLSPTAGDIEDVGGMEGEHDDGQSCTAFISKLYHLCSHEEYRDYIRWNAAGDAFVLAHANSFFAQSILPRFFRHGNVSSFIRQLNLYNFTRLPTIQLLDMLDHTASGSPTSAFSGFSHPHFRRSDEAGLRHIKPKPSQRKRRKAAAVAEEVVKSTRRPSRARG